MSCKYYEEKKYENTSVFKGYCTGTKECEPVLCEGDETKCSIHPRNRTTKCRYYRLQQDLVNLECFGYCTNSKDYERVECKGEFSECIFPDLKSSFKNTIDSLNKPIYPADFWDDFLKKDKTHKLPEIKPITYQRIRVPKIDIAATFTNDTSVNYVASYAQKIVARVMDVTNATIVQAITDFAVETGVTDLYLIDEEFIVSAIKHEMERRKGDKND